MLYAFLACLFPIHVWAIVNILIEVPAWILRMSMWDMLGTIAYPLMYALIESILIFIPILILGFVLPGPLFRDKFIAVSTGIVFVTSAWFAALHMTFPLVRLWGLRQFLPWLGLFLLSLALVYIVIVRFDKLNAAVSAVARRLAVLSGIYLLVDILSVVVIVVRNI